MYRKFRSEFETKMDIEDIKSGWDKKRDELKEYIYESNLFEWQIDINVSPFDVKEVCVPETLRYVGGIDISFDKEDNNLACVCLAVVDAKNNLKKVAHHQKLVTMTEPYVVNYLAFRETDYMLEVTQEFIQNYPDYKPQAILIDGNGVFHKHRFGSACQFGVRWMLEYCQEKIGVPVIGVAKNYLHIDDGFPTRDEIKQTITSLKKSQFDEILYEIIDSQNNQSVCMVRKHPLPKSSKSKDSVGDIGKLAFISVGFGTTLNAAVNLVRIVSTCRVPEPIKLADHWSKDYLIKCRKK